MFFFGLPEPTWLKEHRIRHQQKLLENPVDWHPDIKWQPEFVIRANTWKPTILFDLPKIHSVLQPDRSQIAVSPKGEWCYYIKILPRATFIYTAKGRKKGTVAFDGDVGIPVLYKKAPSWMCTEWDSNPMMSISPMEIMSLRSGNRYAKGRTVIAGLGLGHQLIEVSKRKRVKEIVLIEKSQDLVDFILPKVEPHLVRKINEVIIGDVFEELPKLTADAALIDTFPGYGGNGDSKDRLIRTCPNIKNFWAWGTQYLE